MKIPFLPLFENTKIGDSLAWKYISLEDLPNFRFMFFWFVHFVNGEIIIFNPHLHKNIFKTCNQTIHKIENRIQQIENLWYLGNTFLYFSDFFESHIDKNNISPWWFHIFLYCLKHFGNNEEVCGSRLWQKIEAPEII